jgi:hypothetical protein
LSSLCPPVDKVSYGAPQAPTKPMQPTPSWKPVLKDFLPNTQTLSHETLEKAFQKTLEKTFTETLEKEKKNIPKEKSSTWKPIHPPSTITVDTKEFPEPSSLPAKGNLNIFFLIFVWDLLVSLVQNRTVCNHFFLVVEDRPHVIKFKSNNNEIDGSQKKTKKTLNEYIKSQERKNMVLSFFVR